MLFAPVIASFLTEMEEIVSGTKSLDHLQGGREDALPWTVSLQNINGTDTDIVSLENSQTNSCTLMDSVECISCNGSTGTGLASLENCQCTDWTSLESVDY